MTWRNRLFDVVHEAGAITNDAGANAAVGLYTLTECIGFLGLDYKSQ